MMRELDVRRQLGLSDRSSKTKGPLAAKRASRELERRNKLERQRYPRWDNLFYELQDIILSHLSIADLANVREAGLGAVSIASRQRMHNHMRRRCANLKPLWLTWSRGTRRYRSRLDPELCKPVEFTSKVSQLCLTPTAKGIPDSICEMRALKSLDISRTPHSAMLGNSPPLKTLPQSLALCQGLLELRMSHHAFETLPDCVLQLRNLRRFELEYNTNLKSLPEDIGTRLFQLQFLGLSGCSLISTLPASLLQRLETCLTTQRCRSPLLLTSRFFEDNYLVNTITQDKYPRLNDAFKAGALTDPYNFWVEMDLGE